VLEVADDTFPRGIRRDTFQGCAFQGKLATEPRGCLTSEWEALQNRLPEADLSFLIGENAEGTRPFQLGHRGMLPGMHNLWYMYDGRYKDSGE
jgi:hypothetical protein